MSIEQQVDNIVQGSDVEVDTSAAEAVALTVEEVKKVLGATDKSLQALCLGVEDASTKDGVRAALRQFNRIMRIFMEMSTDDSYDYQVRQAVCELGVSSLFDEILRSATSLREALTGYKTAVLRRLGSALQREENRAHMDEELDNDLIEQFLPSSLADREDGSGPTSSSVVPAAKRGFSAVSQPDVLQRIPKKKRSSIPALASLRETPASGEPEKKSVLLTREKLRQGLNDPKGLLDLIGPSTNALERTKRLELLKNSGLLKESKGAKKSFSERLNDASGRLDLGLGGLSVKDTLTFGAKVLSLPGFLTAKNTSDVENNIVDGKTTWRHQDAYCKMIMAGFLNQVKRILQKYDDVLYGESPETLVQSTHQGIRDLLRSQECVEFFDEDNVDSGTDPLKGNTFIKKIVEAVAPIIPITLRNKSLDGTYLRQALHMLGAVELLFTQYQTDVREHSNPAGVVGLASAMHNGFEGAVLHGNKLESLDDFMKEMKAQYQTSLGFGSTFAKDAFPGTRRRRGGRGRNYFRNRRFAQQGALRGQNGPQGMSSGIYQNANALATMHRAGAGRGIGPCYAYQAGGCHRGASCKFLHVNH